MDNFIKFKAKDGIAFHKEEVVDYRLEKLKAGVYSIYDGGGPFQTVYIYEPKFMKEDLVKFKTGVVHDIMSKCAQMFTEETVAIYKEMEILQKMGLLMYGPPGTGKTSTAYMVMYQLAEQHGAICLDCTGIKPAFIIGAIKKVRSVQDNPIIIFVDEAETTLDSYEDQWLTILDGGESVDKCIFIGCTNYIEKISRRIRERRSRISDIIEVKSLPYEVYKEYIEKKAKSFKPNAVHEFAHHSVENGLTIDELKHSLLNHRVRKIKVLDAIREVKNYSVSEKW